MKKTINSKIVKLISILLFSCLFGFFARTNVSAASETSIDVYSNIYNSASAINAEFEYQITPSSGNPTGATNEPTGLTIKFDNVMPDRNTATVVGEIDFASTTYATPGVYKYEVSEVASSSSDYKISTEKYEIYVTVTNGTIIVNHQAKNLDDGTKGNMNFNHEPAYSYIRINLVVHGDAMDRQEYFRFKLDMDSLCVGCKYDLIGQDEYVKYNDQTVKTVDNYIVTGPMAALTPVQGVPNNIYMKHGQSVTLGLTSDDKPQIPVGTLVRVMGQDINLRKWTMYIDGVETQEFTHVVGEEIEFDIVLERNMLVPNTGLFMETLPYIVLIVFGIGGIIIFTKLKAKNA